MRTTSSLRSASLATLLAGLALLTPPPATADVGVSGLSAEAAQPGDSVAVRVACGSCRANASFPVSLVPAGRAPKPHRCGRNALCPPMSAGPPQLPPYRFLGRTEPVTADGARREEIAESQLRFRVPDVRPGLYAFVVFCAGCAPGPRGSLIASATRDESLRVIDVFSDPALNSP
jgi:hypothetical protein